MIGRAVYSFIALLFATLSAAFSFHGATATCTQTLSAPAQVDTAVDTAAAGSVICLTTGSYGGLTLSPHQSSDVTLQASPGAHVTTGSVSITGSHFVLRGLWIRGEVSVNHSSAFITIDHNDITNGYFGVNLYSWNCSAPDAPTWSGCVSVLPVTDITISGNRIHDIGGSTGEDALHFNNFARVRVTGNEIYGIREGGHHSDCLQTLFGGVDLAFDHNYEHDNQCQGLFINDGDVTNVTIWDNLFLRDDVLGQTEMNIQVFDTHNLVIRNNTNWSRNGDVVRNANSKVVPTVTYDHNVDEVFNDGCCSEGTFQLTDGGYNIFQQAPWTIRLLTSDMVDPKPAFISPTHDDYRLAVNPHQIGVDWRPADQQYGPTS